MMSERFTGPKLSDLQIKRHAEKCASKYFYLNKARLEQIDILDILEFKLEYFAPGFSLSVVDESELARFSSQDGHKESKTIACTDAPTMTIYISQKLYRDAYGGDSWSRMCLAHELGHAILHSDYSDRTPQINFYYKPTVTSFDESKVRGIPLFRDSERQAELFAVFLLAPDALITQCKDYKELAALTHVDHDIARVRFDFYLAEKKGKSPTLALRPR